MSKSRYCRQLIQTHIPAQSSLKSFGFFNKIFGNQNNPAPSFLYLKNGIKHPEHKALMYWDKLEQLREETPNVYEALIKLYKGSTNIEKTMFTKLDEFLDVDDDIYIFPSSIGPIMLFEVNVKPIVRDIIISSECGKQNPFDESKHENEIQFMRSQAYSI